MSNDAKPILAMDSVASRRKHTPPTSGEEDDIVLDDPQPGPSNAEDSQQVYHLATLASLTRICAHFCNIANKRNMQLESQLQFSDEEDEEVRHGDSSDEEEEVAEGEDDEVLGLATGITGQTQRDRQRRQEERRRAAARLHIDRLHIDLDEEDSDALGHGDAARDDRSSSLSPPRPTSPSPSPPRRSTSPEGRVR